MECGVYFTKERLRLYLLALLIFQAVMFAGHLSYALHGYSDFRSFYTAGHMLRSGQLYDYNAEVAAQNALVSPNRYALPFMSPPYAALLFALLSPLSFHAAYWVFVAFNLCFCWVAAIIMQPFCPSLHARWRLTLPLLFLSFMAVGIALVFGQLSLILLVLYCACFAAVQTCRPFLAGVFLSFALLKFQIALPIALLFLVWRQWRFLAGFISGTAALILISIPVTGLHGLFAYFHSLLFMAGQTSNETKYAMFSAQMPNLYGFFHAIFAGRTGFVLTAASSLLVLLWAATRKPSLPVALLAAILVSYHFYPYDLTLLLLPICLIFNAELSGIHNRFALYASAFMVLVPLVRFLLPSDFQFLYAIPVAVLFLTIGEIGAIPSETMRCTGLTSTADLLTT